ncbi:MAG: hypothetical protein JNL90_11950 [Planctomycetes bacterium]|nr:hypothetical protein [Planctomycetota bacterium]
MPRSSRPLRATALGSSLSACAALTMFTAMAAPSHAQTFTHKGVGTQAGAKHGQVVAALSDVDGDGGADYAVGAPDFDNVAWWWNYPDAGRVTIVNGRTGATIRTHTGGSSSEKFGSAISVTPDCDADGKSDYAIGAPGFSGSKGRVSVYSSASGALLWTHDGTFANDRHGAAIARIADANGDGHDEIAIGRPQSGVAPGYVHVRDRNNQHVMVIGAFTGISRFGSALAKGPDLNKDGTADFLVGAPLADVTTPFGTWTDAGIVYGLDAKTGALIYSFWELASGAQFGTSISALLDTNADGYGEFVVGAPAWSNWTGFACVYSGKTGNKLFRVDSTYSTNEYFGQSVCNAGDWNGDGKGDFAVGIPGYSGAVGAIEVHSGTNGALLHLVDAVTLNWGAGEGNGNFGWSLAGGLFDNDFAFDLLIGDPAYVKSGSIRGSHHLLERY